MLALTVHDPFGQIQILSIDLKLQLFEYYLPQIGGYIIVFGVGGFEILGPLKKGMGSGHDVFDGFGVEIGSKSMLKLIHKEENYI